MSPPVVTKTTLLEEFLAFQDTTDNVKVLRFRRKVQKHIKSSKEDDEQLHDVVRVLDLWLEEIEYNEFIHSFRIALPVAERLSSLENPDFYDIVIAAYVVGYEKDYGATYIFAQKVLSEVEKYQSHPQYISIKLGSCMNVLLRLLRARYFELNPSQVDENIQELSAMFNEFSDIVMAICAEYPEHWECKTVAHIRKALFEKNYLEVDAGLTAISEKGSYLMYKSIAKEVNGFNASVGIDKTKMMLNLQVGKNIRKIRKSKFLRIEDCAKELSMTPSVLQSIEQGKRSAHIHNLYKLSETFGLSLEEIVKGKSVPKETVNAETLPEDIQNLVDICKLLEAPDIETLETLAAQLAKKHAV